MNAENEEKRVLMAVARLQEFYDNDSLHIFFHECEEYGLNVVTGFLMVEEAVMRHVGEYGEAPVLRTVVEHILASFQGLPLDATVEGVVDAFAKEDISAPTYVDKEVDTTDRSDVE